jgi:hypothetical protein
MKLIRGVDELGIEDKCNYVIPEGWGSKGHLYTENDEDAVFAYSANAVLTKIAEEHGFPLGLFGSGELKASIATKLRAAESTGSGASVIFASTLFGAIGMIVGVVVGKRGVGQNGGYTRVADVDYQQNYQA